MLRPLAIALAFGLVAGGFGLGALRVAELERGELQLETRARPLSELRARKHATPVSARLLSARLEPGERVLFELCSPERLEPSVVQDAFSVAVLNLDRNEKMLLVPLDAEHMAQVKHSARGACLALGGGVIEVPGEHSLEVVWLDEGEPGAAASAVPLTGRVLARTPLRTGDGAYMLAVALGVLLALGLLWGGRADPAAGKPPPGAASGPSAPGQGGRDGPVKVGLLALAAFAALAATTQLPLFGAALAMAKGSLLVAVQVGAALWLVQRAGGESRVAALSLVRPARSWPWLLGAAGGAVALWAAAQLAMAFVPATSEAPIQSFISWPSGLLSFAALGVLLPVAEEIFFRGYLYRSALPLGRTAAFVITVVLFVALHAQQSWGNWGGLVAIGITGAALTALRALSGSVLVPALAHLLYNFALSVRSF